MFKLEKKLMNEQCPKCKIIVEFTLEQIANEETVICDCGTTLKLKDSKESAKKTIEIDQKIDQNIGLMISTLTD